jgi:hypothetical protein
MIMAELRSKRISHMSGGLRGIADQIKVRLHLVRMEAKKLRKQLEPKLREVTERLVGRRASA